MEPPPADQTRQIIQVMTTVGSEQAASQLAEKLIEKKLAACIQIDAKIQSVYAWKGETCRDPEWRLVIKTLDSHWIAVREAISENHPYELPEILGQTMAWSTPEYRHWVIEQVQA